MNISLREWEIRPGVELTRDQVAALARSDAVKLSPDRTTDGTWQLQAQHHVGVFVADGLEIRIRPKVGVDRLLALLCETIDRVRWHETDTLWAQTDDLLATIAGSFCTQSEHAIANGLLQGYQTVSDALFGVKGRIDMSAQLSRRAGLILPVEVIYDDYTVDILENGMLCGAVAQLLRLSSVPAELRARLRRLAMHLIDVVPVPAQPAPPVVEFTRLNARYRSAITLARLILRSCALEEDESRDIRGSGLLVNMNKVFEDVVGEGLRRAGHPSGVTLSTQHHDWLDTARKLEIVPDLLWKRGGVVCGVGDIKNKRPATFRIDNEDVYQVLAYATRYGLDEAHLVYAEAPPVAEVSVNSTTLRLHHVDLGLPRDERQARLDRIAHTVSCGTVAPMCDSGSGGST